MTSRPMHEGLATTPKPTEGHLHLTEISLSNHNLFSSVKEGFTR
jgi:hypothetical protein